MKTDQSRQDDRGLSGEELAEGFRSLGLNSGEVVLVHSAMRTMGYVRNGPQAVVEALLQNLGSNGTLILPTFTFVHEIEKNPIINPKEDSSEMGAISEAGRTHPEALRSLAFRHNFAAIGRRATVLTSVDPALSPFDLRSIFGVMLALNTQVVLLGVTYSSSTSHHFAEFVCEVPYRQIIPLTAKVLTEDGLIRIQPMRDYQPKSEGNSYYGTRGPDFNRLGRMLEKQGRVTKVFIGNAAVRRFAMRDLIDLAQTEALKDYNVFRTPEGHVHQTTTLEFGRSVLSPEMTDGAGRIESCQWCVEDEGLLVMPQ